MGDHEKLKTMCPIAQNKREEFSKLLISADFDYDKTIPILRKLFEQRKLIAQHLMRSHPCTEGETEWEILYRYINNDIKQVLGI